MNKRSELSLPVLLSAVTDTVLQTRPRPTETRCSQRLRLPRAISVAKASRRCTREWSAHALLARQLVDVQTQLRAELSR